MGACRSIADATPSVVIPLLVLEYCRTLCQVVAVGGNGSCFLGCKHYVTGVMVFLCCPAASCWVAGLVSCFGFLWSKWAPACRSIVGWTLGPVSFGWHTRLLLWSVCTAAWLVCGASINHSGLPRCINVYRCLCLQWTVCWRCPAPGLTLPMPPRCRAGQANCGILLFCCYHGHLDWIRHTTTNKPTVVAVCCGSRHQLSTFGGFACSRLATLLCCWCHLA